MRVEIRPPRRADWPDWLAMRDQLYAGLDEDFHMREMELYANAPDKGCLIAASGREVFGFAEMSLRNVVDGCITSPVGYLEGIFVRMHCRGLGLAAILLEEVEAWCRAKGCCEIATDSEIDDTEAQNFHERMGFRETYRIVQFRKPLD